MKPLVFYWAFGCWLFCLCNATVHGGVTFTNLFSFSGTNGIEPEGQLLQAPDGWLYGTTRETTREKHGNSGNGFNGHGTVYKITTNGGFTTLFSFVESQTNGAYPRAGLIWGRDGCLYGTTAAGSVVGSEGTVFKITTNGILTTLATLASSNGGGIKAKLLLAKDDTLYGVAAIKGLRKNGNPFGDDFAAGLVDNGTVFSLTTNGILKTVVSFNGTNGANPEANLIQGQDGNLYGVTLCDGLDNYSTNAYSNHGFGTAFKIDAQGILTTLAVFNGTNGKDGCAIAKGRDGNLYGITTDGGGTVNTNEPNFTDWTLFTGVGTVFKISPNGKLTTVFVFDGKNGKFPESFIIGRDGNFYGTTTKGGMHNFGTIFKMTPNGKLTTLYSFTENNGSWPNHTTLMQGIDGSLYGTTTRCGSNLCGSIFRLTIK